MVFLFSLLISLAHAEFVIVPDDLVISEMAPGSSAPLNNQLGVLIWNIEKGKAQYDWAYDFQKLMDGKSLALLQEGIEDNYVPNVLKSISRFGWFIARTFFMETDRQATGVISGSPQKPVQASFLRTRDLEPIINTPKMAFLSTYDLLGGSQLLVVNVHAINFTSPEPFFRQVDDIVKAIGNWNGKVLVAGDFNTWISARTKYLVGKMKALGLEHVVFEKDPRQLVLDHVFIRGCQLSAAQVHGNIESSDHYPLTTDFSCQN
ncbi:MAG: endonuclease/exonuclease/phosphatase family protein [Pseudobdellovibrionaceae bacterium]